MVNVYEEVISVEDDDLVSVVDEDDLVTGVGEDELVSIADEDDLVTGVMKMAYDLQGYDISPPVRIESVIKVR